MSTLRFIYILFIGLCLPSSILAQGFLADLNEIPVDVNQNNEILYIHKIQQDETLFSLARFFRIPVQKLMILNSIENDQIISVGSQIKIPIDAQYILQSSQKEASDWIPIIYTVKKQETLYKIAKTYFQQEIETFNQRNNISSFIINENQKLTAGYWPNRRLKEPQVNDQELAVVKAKDKEVKEIHSERENPTTVLTKEMLTDNESQINNTESSPSVKPHTLIQSIDRIPDAHKHQTKINSASSSERNIPTIDANKLVLVNVVSDNNEEHDMASDEGTYSKHEKLINTESDELSIHEEEVENISSQTEPDDLSFTYKVIDKQGICVWDKSDPEETHLLAFHKTAKIGSYINLEYPLTGRTVRVQVIDNIKSDLYSDDIDVMVTKAVAQHLGARDSRIQINMSYYE